MANIIKEQKIIGELLNKDELHEFVCSNLKQSLPDIGFSGSLVQELTADLRHIDVKKFIKNHKNELDQVFTIGFFQEIVPDYFGKYVIPEIPASQKFLDVGCGTGILLKRLEETNKYENLMGIDVLKYPEWKKYTKPNLEFKIINDNEFSNFLWHFKPDSLAITWTLHHMDAIEQEQYLKIIYSNIEVGSTVVILEDAYSDMLVPENGQGKYKTFMKWDNDNRKKIMSVYDWVANRILAQRKDVNIPFSYRTMEEWIGLFKQIGFKTEKARFIGFPEKRDINIPQSLIVLKK